MSSGDAAIFILKHAAVKSFIRISCIIDVLPLTCYNLDIHDPITIVFRRSVTEKVRHEIR